MRKNAAAIFSMMVGSMTVFFIFFAVPQAHAYAVGSTTNQTGPGNGNYDIGGSFQNLISPFTGFVSSLKWNNGVTVNANGVNFAWPTVSVTPVLETSAQSTLNQWFGEFGRWLYGSTGIQLSGILFAISNLFVWALGLAQQGVNWILGALH